MRPFPFHRPDTSRAPGPFRTRTLRDPWSLVVAGDLDGEEFDDNSSYTINPVTGVLTIHWADGRASHYSPSTWHRIEDQPTAPYQDRGVI